MEGFDEDIGFGFEGCLNLLFVGRIGVGVNSCGFDQGFFIGGMNEFPGE